MNNPGIDTTTWERLKKKWDELEKKGHTLKINFKLIVDKNDEEETLAIDVIQKIDDEYITETVQHQVGEAYESLGIAGVSMERLVEVYKQMLHELHSKANLPHAYLIVSMRPNSIKSGEVRAYLEKRKKNQKISVQTSYQHYFLLNALRDKMIEIVGEGWSQVKTVYWQGTLEFYFEY